MTHFTPGSALMGGALIGLAASLLLAANGRIAGVSGIFAGLLRPAAGDVGWRAAFVLGLIVAGVLLTPVLPAQFGLPTGRPVAAVALAGALVGVGVRMGNGCTSGHGVCGLSRFSRRSLVAVLTFMTTGVLAATAARLLLGAA